MAKSRAQRKAERRRREQQQARERRDRAEDSRAQHDTQVPESADVLEAELAEQGVDLDSLRGAPSEGDGAPPEQAGAEPAAPAPSRADVGAPAEERLSRRERRRLERERRRRAKESEQRRQPREQPVERRRRGVVLSFLSQVAAELRRVQWPDRPHLIQASAVTLVFIALLAAYLGALDVIFNWLVQRIL